MDMNKEASITNRWSVPADVESLAWNPHSEDLFVVRFLNCSFFNTRFTAVNSFLYILKCDIFLSLIGQS